MYVYIIISFTQYFLFVFSVCQCFIHIFTIRGWFMKQQIHCKNNKKSSFRGFKKNNHVFEEPYAYLYFSLDDHQFIGISQMQIYMQSTLSKSTSKTLIGNNHTLYIKVVTYWWDTINFLSKGVGACKLSLFILGRKCFILFWQHLAFKYVFQN